MRRQRRDSRIRSISIVVVAVLFLAVFGAEAAFAQDANYWTNQYGNQARLLGGVVVGSSDDVASVYYNPGRLALIADTSLVLAGNVVRYTNIRPENALGEGLSLSSSKLGGVPSLFAGDLRLGFLGKTRMAYSFLTRYDLSINFQQRADLTSRVEVPLDLLTASIDYKEYTNEYWAGLTWAVPLGQRFGLGVTAFGLFRDQDSEGQTLVQAQVDTASGIALRRRGFEYLYGGVLGKIGLGADLHNWKLGLSVTTPNLKLYGNGNIGVDEVLVGQDLNGNGSSPSFILTDLQSDLPASYHSPLSSALGVSYIWSERTLLDFTAEWFNEVGFYYVLEGAPLAGADTVVTPEVVDQRKSIINFGLGVEHTFNPRLIGYASFRTDYSSAVPTNEHSAAISIWNIYHIGAGLNFPVGSSEFTFGGIYAFGSQEREESIDVIPDQDEGADIELPQDLVAKFRRITFILGFSIDV